MLPFNSYAFMGDDKIALLQAEISEWSIGDRIAFWAEQFIGIPYDKDPNGEYVTKRVLVSDASVDCMYHAFRSVELALGKTPSESLEIALDKRFHTIGRLEANLVANYEDRFRYGEDMIDSGKWGKEITSELGHISEISGSRGRDRVKVISKKDVPNILKRLKNGDIIFFVKDPKKRRSDEIIGHIGIIKIEGDDVYLVTASGVKNRGGRVRKTLFSAYNSTMPFAGIRVSRLK